MNQKRNPKNKQIVHFCVWFGKNRSVLYHSRGRHSLKLKDEPFALSASINCSHFCAAREETWQSCYVAKGGWCFPWRSSSFTASDPIVSSREMCLFGNLLVSIASANPQKCSVNIKKWCCVSIFLLSPPSGSEHKFHISHGIQHCMVCVFYCQTAIRIH